LVSLLVPKKADSLRAVGGVSSSIMFSSFIIIGHAVLRSRESFVGKYVTRVRSGFRS
jgi:hypothetical protein